MRGACIPNLDTLSTAIEGIASGCGTHPAITVTRGIEE